MSKSGSPARLPPSGRTLLAGGTILLWGLYLLLFLAIGSGGPLDAALTAAANVLPVLGLALVVHACLRSFVMGRALDVQALLHPLLAIGFSLTWYALTLLLLGLKRGVQGEAYELPTFYGAAFLWQAFQGIILYAAIAAICYAIRGGRMAAPTTIIDAASPDRLDRWLVRTSDSIRPVQASDIVSIEGAQDYSELVTTSGRHLVRLSLAEFEARLDPGRFVRVHRSSIINLEHLEQLEPAGGGRMIATMRYGGEVEVSRAGTKALRSLVL